MVWGAGGQLHNPHKISRKTRHSLPPSFLLGGWSQVSEGAGEEERRPHCACVRLLLIWSLSSVTGEQVKPVFSASRLSNSKLAQIW